MPPVMHATMVNTLHISESDVLLKLQKLNTNKSPGPDLIHPKILFEIKQEIYKPLTYIFNKSIQQKMIPKDWCLANISAIHKKGNKSMVSNYRPISLTSVAY